MLSRFRLSRLTLACFLTALFLCLPFAHAQEKEKPKSVTPAAESVSESNVVPSDGKQQTAEVLDSLKKLIDKRTASIKKLQEEVKKATSEELKTENETRIAALKKERTTYRQQFEELATGFQQEQFDAQEKHEFTITKEFQELVKPIVGELKHATAKPRELENLRNKVSGLEDRVSTADKAIQNINTILPNTKDDLKKYLTNKRDEWMASKQAYESQLSASKLQLTKLENDESRSIGSSVSKLFKNFFKSRAWNLLIALAAFIVTLLIARKFFSVVQRISPLHKAESRSIFRRSVDLFYVAFSVLLAMAAALIILYFSGDWALLSLTLILLVGVFWGLRVAAPVFIEQIRLILNLGSVREAERVIYNGIPWEVKRLAVYTELQNKALEGGSIRLPARTLLELHSRPFSDYEHWFPTQRKDWVSLSDDTFGKVVCQTPEYVQLALPGGAKKTYATPAFLDLAPINLSNGFRITSLFGIDYSHQNISTTEVAAIFHEALDEAIKAEFGSESLVKTDVVFSAANASSLDYYLVADFRGEAANKYQFLPKFIQEVCVNVCNAQGWIIPFQQITIGSRGHSCPLPL